MTDINIVLRMLANESSTTITVIAQADAPYRFDPTDIMRLRARNNNGDMVPLGSIVKVMTVPGPDRIVRYNLYTAAELQGNATPGISTGEAISEMEKLAKELISENRR